MTNPRCIMNEREALARRLHDHAHYLDEQGCDGSFSRDIMEAARILGVAQRPLAYRLDHPALGIELSICEPDKDWAARGWTVTPLAASLAQSERGHLSLREEFIESRPVWRIVRIVPEHRTIVSSFRDRESAEAAFKTLALTSTEPLPPDWKQDQAETSRLAPRVSSTDRQSEAILKHADELHDLGFNAGWNGAVEECAKAAEKSLIGHTLTPGGLARQDEAEEIAERIRALAVPSTQSGGGK